MQVLVLPLEGMHLRYDTVRVERASDGLKARDRRAQALSVVCAPG
jgi:hypothetical protein